MANNSLSSRGQVFHESSVSLSLHLVHLLLPSSFCRSCLCQVTRQLFPPSLVRVLWAVAFEYNGPVDAPPSTNTFYSVSVFLFFPRVFFRVLVCFAPGSAFFSRRFCSPSCPRSLQSRPLS